MPDFYTHSKFVKELIPDDFDPVNTWRLKSEECHLVLFYCDWCKYCQDLKQAWEELGKRAVFCNVVALNCATYPEHIEKIRYDMPHLVKTYPTIIVYKGGEPAEEYRGDRSVGDLVRTCVRVCSAE